MVKPFKGPEPRNVPSWAEYFLTIAKAAAMRSKDPSTQVGCVIIDSQNKIKAQGFNGFVAGCDESFMSYQRDLKMELIIHAEENACLAATEDLTGCCAIVTHSPCNKCLSTLFQKGITHVLYEDPTPVVERASELQKEALARILKSNPGRLVLNIHTGQRYDYDLLSLKDPEAESMKEQIHAKQRVQPQPNNS